MLQLYDCIKSTVLLSSLKLNCVVFWPSGSCSYDHYSSLSFR